MATWTQGERTESTSGIKTTGKYPAAGLRRSGGWWPGIAMGALILAGSLTLVVAETPPPVKVETLSDVMVPMRDGVRLATDVYLPVLSEGAAREKLPVILSRIPYNKTGAKVAGNYFASHGYAFVAQDTRGRYGSEGTWRFLTDDGEDGKDCAAWIGKQPWSNGRIGMIGTSYVGGTQHAMALADVPELATVIPVDAASNMGRQSMRNAGAFELRFWNWIMLNAGRGSVSGKDPAVAAELKALSDNRMAYLPWLPLRKGATPLRLAPEYEDWLVEAMNHGADDDFWKAANILEDPKRYKDMPVYLVGGWYDSWAGNTTANYAALSQALKSPVYLVMGPWIHGQQTKSSHGQVDFGEAAAIKDEWAWRCEWFDHWMKGKANAVGTAAPFASKVRLFVMGTGDGGRTEKGLLRHGGAWRDEQEWPLKRAVATPMYFHEGGRMMREKPGQELRSDSDSAATSTSYDYDPRDPVPTLGGNISSADGIMQQGAWNQRGGEAFWNWPKPVPLSARRDVLVFQTEPLAEDTEVTGEIEVKLWVSSSARDTDFTAKLVDVYPANADWPDGFDINLTDGIVRARFRESLKTEKLMEPGTVYPMTIKLYPTSNVFKKGHRIRVDISSSNFPRFDLNPNTGEPLNGHRRMVVATNVVYHDAERPSQIVLPVVRWETSNGKDQNSRKDQASTAGSKGAME